MNDQSSQAEIKVCVLAAGSSSRFGATKLVKPLHGKPLLQHAVLAAQEASDGPLYLVVGHDQDSVIEAADSLNVKIVINDDYQQGIGTSIAAGVGACRENADAILVLLADQPLITAAHLINMIDTWSGAATEIIATAFDDTLGPPILFPKSAFDSLGELKGDTGAKILLTSGDYIVRSIEFPAAGIDVDTAETLRDLNRD